MSSHASISLNPECAQVAARRKIRIGDRQFGLSGCAPDLFIYAAVLGPSLQVEETCSTTRKSIRIEFTPHGPVQVEPPEAYVCSSRSLRRPRRHNDGSPTTPAVACFPSETHGN